MSCVAGVSTSGQLVTQVVGVCGLAYGRGGAALRTAAQSAASQAIAHLVRQLSEWAEEFVCVDVVCVGVDACLFVYVIFFFFFCVCVLY